MKAGDVIFVPGGTDAISKGIEYFDPGPFCHVAIAVSEDKIFEAQYYMKSNIVPMHYTDFEIVSLNLSDKQITKLQVICTVLEGKWYGYKEILGFICHKEFGTDMKYFDNPNHLICSQALSLILYLLDKIDTNMPDITPNGLYKLLTT